MAKNYVLTAVRGEGKGEETRQLRQTGGMAGAVYDLLRDGVLRGDKPNATLDMRKAAIAQAPEIAEFLAGLQARGWETLSLHTETDLADGSVRESGVGTVSVEAAAEYATAYLKGEAESTSNPARWSTAAVNAASALGEF